MYVLIGIKYRGKAYYSKKFSKVFEVVEAKLIARGDHIHETITHYDNDGNLEEIIIKTLSGGEYAKIVRAEKI